MSRKIAAVLATLAVACEVFGYWGVYTKGGQQAFDEMAGMIPFFSMVMGGVFALGALIAWYIDKRGRRSSQT